MRNKPTVIDAFCGAGGLSLGFVRAGFESVFAFDNDPTAIATYRHNLGPSAYVEDAWRLDKRLIETRIGRPLDDIDVVAGGPPCQGFSVQRRGDDIDERNHLVLEYVRLVLEIRPRFFLMENVAGLLSQRGKPFMEEISRLSSESGYALHIEKLNAADFGVAQDRNRVFIVGERVDGPILQFEFPRPNTPPSKRKTVRDAIHDLMNKGEDQVPNHRGDRLTAINLERIRALKPGQARDSLPEHLQLECHKRNVGHRHLDVYGRMAWDSPSSTITARFDSFSRGRFGHPELDRSITLREGARLQSFPDSFIFLGSKVEVARQIGNAVPPLLAEAVASQLKALICQQREFALS